jgi:hypothetical protein
MARHIDAQAAAAKDTPPKSDRSFETEAMATATPDPTEEPAEAAKPRPDPVLTRH